MRRKLDTGEGDAAAAGAGAGGGGAGAEESGDEEGKVEGTETQQVGESEEGKEEGGASSESENSGGEDGEGGKPGKKRKRVGKKGKEKRKKRQKTDLWIKQGAVVYQSPEAFGVEWAEETYPGHLQRKVMQGVVKTVTKRKNKVHSVLIEYNDEDTSTWVLDDIKDSVYEISSLDVDFVAYEKEKAAVGGSKGGKK